MDTVYRVTVEVAKKKDVFTVTWEDTGTNTSETVEVSASDIVPGDVERFRQKPDLHLEIGRKLFGFLDSEKHLLQRAMDEASRRGGPLTLLLCPGDQTADWPFELLARENSFLLPHRLHLVRCVSGWGAEKKVTPQDRPLKLLFMACSALDVHTELDFEREEETIFHVTEKLPVDMEVEDSGSLEGLREQLLREPYDVVHLSGHADIDKEGRPYFIMEDETGYMRKVSPGELWQEALIENPPRLLFLSGCRTGEKPGTAAAPETPETPENLESEAAVSFCRELVEKYHVPAVLGWGSSVGDEQATHAEQMLYRELSRGKSITEAVQRARYHLITTFAHNRFPAWPLLRLFAGGESLDAMVKAGQKVKPKPRRMTHVYLEQSRVKVLAEGFVGRRRQIQRSLRALKRDRDKVGVLLLGTAGLGKSCLAGKLCERFKDHTPVIVHGRLNTVTLQKALETAFMVTGDKGGEDILAAEAEMTKKLAKLCASCFKERNYLLLLDDFEQNLAGADKGEPGALLPEAAELAAVLLHYLPFCGKETLLMVTSRYGFSLADDGGGAGMERLETVRLTGFRETEQIKKARELTNILYYRVPSMRMQLLAAGRGNPRLMEWLDVLVGRMARDEVSRLLEAVKDKQEAFIRSHVIRELLQRGGEPMAVFMRWFSIFRIPAGLQGARLVGEKAGLAEWEELLALGLDLSLFEHHQARERYGVTPLLRDELLGGLEEEEVRFCHEAAFDYYKAVCEPMGDDIDPILVEEWIYHALARGEEDVASDKGGDLVKYLRDRLAYLESRRVGEWVLAEKKRELSTEHDAFLLNALAYTLYDLGDHRKAVDYFEQVLSIYKKIHGTEHQYVAVALNNLGEAWGNLGDPKKAVDYHQQALNIDRAVFGEQHPNVARGLNNLGGAWRNLGDPKKAVDYYQQALNIWKKVYGESHPQVAVGMNNLGTAWDDLGDHRKAVDYFEQALNIDRAVFGEQHPKVAIDLNNLGGAWAALGDHRKAVDYYQQALNIDRAVFGEQHPKVAIRLNNLGAAYFSLGQRDTAKGYFEKAHAIFKKFFGDHHPHTKIAAKLLKDCQEAVRE
jgi:tetratricopeptide (TPR) repeat protein